MITTSLASLNRIRLLSDIQAYCNIRLRSRIDIGIHLSVSLGSVRHFAFRTVTEESSKGPGCFRWNYQELAVGSHAQAQGMRREGSTEAMAKHGRPTP